MSRLSDALREEFTRNDGIRDAGLTAPAGAGRAAEYGIAPEKLASIGGSASGNLAAMLGMNVPSGAFPGEAGIYAAGPFVAMAVEQFGPMDFRSMDDQALANAGHSVDCALIWDQPHTQADYPGEFLAWIEEICAD